MTPDWRMTREIAQQPELFEANCAQWIADAESLRTQIYERDHLAVIGRGSSRHAAIYASYLYGLITGRHAVEFRPWMTTRPVPQADWSNTSAFAFSASGQSTDIARAAEWISERGGFVVGITNADSADCALGEAADALFHLDMGDERAVPATKTFNAQLFAAAALLGFDLEEAIPETAAALKGLEDGETARHLADLVDDARMIAWIARGPSMAAACDAALKCRESARVESTGWSSAEVQHGHIGSFDERDRAVIFSDANQPAGSFSSVAKALLSRKTPYAVTGLNYYQNDGGMPAHMLDVDLPGALWARTPVFAYLSQQTALELALRRGLNPDCPAGLQKVTETR